MKNFFDSGMWMVFLTIVIIACCMTVCILFSNKPTINENYFSAPTYVKVQKVFDTQTGVYYYITSTGDITPVLDIYGRPLIVDGGDGTHVDPMRGEISYDAAQQ